MLLDAMALVACRGHLGMAWRAWVSFFPKPSDFASHIAKYFIHGIFDALAAEEKCMWTRAALMHIMALHSPPPISDLERAASTLWNVERRYSLAWNMEEAQRRFLQRCAPALSLSERERARYMFHYAKRETIDPFRSAKGKTKVKRHVNGEIVRNSFVAFRDATETLRFFSEWSAAEAAASLQTKTMVFECGSYASDIARKWVVDVDADLSKLSPEMQHDWSSGHDAVVAFALAMSKKLHHLKYLHRPCHFAITSRHVPQKKLSWHITLCALAPFPVWRKAMAAVVLPEYPMQAFVDEKILKNSKSQYMQIIGSTKVVMGQPGNGVCFEKVGLFDGKGGIIMMESQQEHLFFAASSSMVHDPWSLPFLAGFNHHHHKNDNNTTPNETTATKKKRAPPTDKKGVIKKPKKSECPPQPWMRHLLAAKDGLTHFSTIPSMSDKNYWCPLISDATLKFHACAVDAPLCVRTLASEQRVYRHGSDRNAMVMCTETRMFMRCFSVKCKGLVCPPRRVAGGGGWIELFETDLDSEAVRNHIIDISSSSSAIAPDQRFAPRSEGRTIRVERHRIQIEAVLTQKLLKEEEEDDDALLLLRLNSVPRHSAAFPLIKNPTVVMQMRRGPCVRCRGSSKKTRALIVVLEDFEKFSGAYGYTLLVRFECCVKTYVDPWTVMALYK